MAVKHFCDLCEKETYHEELLKLAFTIDQDAMSAPMVNRTIEICAICLVQRNFVADEDIMAVVKPTKPWEEQALDMFLVFLDAIGVKRE